MILNFKINNFILFYDIKETMSRQKLLITLAFIALIMLGCGIYLESRAGGGVQPPAAQTSSRPSDFSSRVASGRDTYRIKEGSFNLDFRKTQSVRQTYMVFGMNQLTRGDRNFSDGYIAGIPLQQAKTLLRKYPRMSYCGAPGSEEAKNAIQNIMVFMNSSAAKNSFAQAVRTDSENVKKGGLRTCVQVSGDSMQFKQGTYEGNPIGGLDSNGQRWIDMQEITVVPCM